MHRHKERALRLWLRLAARAKHTRVKSLRVTTLVLLAALCVTLTLTVSAQRRRNGRAQPAAAAGMRPTVTELNIAGDTVRLHAFHIPLAQAELNVVDVGMGREIAPYLDRHHASLVFNGGYFDLRMRPEGLVIAGGRTVSEFVPGLGGGVLTVQRGQARLHDGEGFTPRQLWGVDFGMQCKPRLVVDRAVNIRSDDGRRADRTGLCIRDQGRELVVYIARSEDFRGGDGPTLRSFAEMLQREGCENALNLDGGPSTGVAWRQDGSIRSLPPRGSIRHAITVRLR